MNSEHQNVTYVGAGVAIGVRQVSEKEMVQKLFIGPLSRMKGDDAFVFLMVCFPLIEAVIRFEKNIPDNQEVTLSDNSPALAWFAKFLEIPKAHSREVWDAFRNGLLHRAMVKSTINYDITGTSGDGRPAQRIGDKTVIYVWDLRDRLLEKLNLHHRKLWGPLSTKLPSIGLRSY